MRYWEAEPSYVYLTGRNGEDYFIATYDGPPVQRFSENTAKSFYNLEFTFDSGNANINVEIMFGPGKTQKAHRLNRHFCFFCQDDKTYEDFLRCALRSVGSYQ